MKPLKKRIINFFICCAMAGLLGGIVSAGTSPVYPNNPDGNNLWVVTGALSRWDATDDAPTSTDTNYMFRTGNGSGPQELNMTTLTGVSAVTKIVIAVNSDYNLTGAPTLQAEVDFARYHARGPVETGCAGAFANSYHPFPEMTWTSDWPDQNDLGNLIVSIDAYNFPSGDNQEARIGSLKATVTYC